MENASSVGRCGVVVYHTSSDVSNLLHNPNTNRGPAPAIDPYRAAPVVPSRRPHNLGGTPWKNGQNRAPKTTSRRSLKRVGVNGDWPGVVGALRMGRRGPLPPLPASRIASAEPDVVQAADLFHLPPNQKKLNTTCTIHT